MKPTYAGALVVVLCGSYRCSDPDIADPTDILVETPEPDSFHDPLSMPEVPTLSVNDFRTSELCGDCHQEHFSQWKTSSHSYAMKDPIFRGLLKIRQSDFNGEQDQFCTQCHSAIGTRSGDCADNFSFDDLSPVTIEGVTCEACHKVSSLARTFNSGHHLDPSGPIRGSIADPVDNPFHESEYSPLHKTSDFCGGCHDVREVNGLNLERPFEEWLASPSADIGQTCQSCHMPTYRGHAAPGAPERTLHEHRFVGVEVPLEDNFFSNDEERRAAVMRTEQLLKSSATLVLETATEVSRGAQLDLVITVHNLIDGHSLPTGSTFNRQLWLKVTATDATGATIYQTGYLDSNGDLLNAFSEIEPYGDSDLIDYGSTLTDRNGNPTVFTWRATEHTRRSIPPKHSRTHTLFVPTDSASEGPLRIEVALQFRAFPPFLLRLLGLNDLIGHLSITTIDDATAVVALR